MFSEKFLMKRVLDDIFSKKYFYKKEERESELQGEPDYYLRHNNDIFIFENKDVLVNKEVKASADIEQINQVLKTKFLKDGKKSVGIGQLINTIKEIESKKFRFDDYVNTKTHFNVYPILIVHDRIFQTLGINYRLNHWFKSELEEKLDLNCPGLNIKGLTVIDIDTLILYSNYFKQKDRNFKDLLNMHLKEMATVKKVNVDDHEERVKRVNKNLSRQLAPISSRDIQFQFDIKQFISQFKDVITE